jgi:hypothetical protein
MIKFKGWESVRWLEERIVPETERERIQSGMIWHNVRFLLSRNFMLEWIARILKMVNMKKNQ